MSLSKTFQLKDTKSFEVRMTADNAFNIVQYAGVNTQFDSTAVGEVTSAQSNADDHLPRPVQVLAMTTSARLPIRTKCGCPTSRL